MEGQKIKVLALLPMELPKEIDLDNTLEAMQNFVGGLIECITLSDTGSEVTLVCNDEGKLLGLPTVSLLCTPYALREKKNQRIFVHIEYSASPTTFLGRKYGIQVADFQDEAVWSVIWLADK